MWMLRTHNMRRIVTGSFLFVFLFCGRLKAGTTTVIDGTVVDTGGGHYYLGRGSSLNTLIITNGGILRAGFADIGEFSGDQGNQAVVTGTNSLWHCDAFLYIGVAAPNNTVTVSDGGTVS